MAALFLREWGGGAPHQASPLFLLQRDAPSLLSPLSRSPAMVDPPGPRAPKRAKHQTYAQRKRVSFRGRRAREGQRTCAPDG